jgi:hypothetical protein
VGVNENSAKTPGNSSHIFLTSGKESHFDTSTALLFFTSLPSEYHSRGIFFDYVGAEAEYVEVGLARVESAIVANVSFFAQSFRNRIVRIVPLRGNRDGESSESAAGALEGRRGIVAASASDQPIQYITCHS